MDTDAESRVLLPQDVTPTHYALELTPDLDALIFGCSLNITVTVNKSTDTVTLHSKEISIESATFNGENTLTQINYDLKATTVTLAFEKEFPLGEGNLLIKYKGILNGDMAGFYKSNYTDAEGKKKVMANTQFESLDARRALPCWDEPAVKATFSVTMIVPSNLTALSNMPEEYTTYIAGGKKKVQFQKSPKMSTYLLAFAVGEFDFIQGVTKNQVSIRVFSPPGRAQEGRFALDVAIRALEFYDDVFAVPYPLPKLDMLCCTEFAMGAMENWGLVTYREVDLMIDNKASSARRQRVAIVVAHELAHQWFGNLVTMEWWNDLWLNEGFASFMEHTAVQALFPDWNIWEQYTTDTMGAALRLDSLRSSHPIQVPIKHAEEVEQVFDAISYCKGSSVVRMAEGVLGDDLFREGLRLYMKTHAYGNTRTDDLWAAWSKVSGIDVGALMASWTNQMGYPYLKVVGEVWGEGSVEITLEQGWFLSDGSTTEADASKTWRIPLLFTTSKMTSDKAVIMENKVQTFTVPLSGADDYVKINAGQQALCRVAHSVEMTKRLQPAIKSKTIGPVDRAGLLLDAYALTKAGYASLESAVMLLKAFVAEDNSSVWTAVGGVLGGLHVLLEAAKDSSPDAEAAFANYVAFGGKLVKKALLMVGWDAKEGEGHSVKLLRSTVVGLLDVFCFSDEEVLAESRRRYAAHWSDASHTVLPGEYKSTVFRIVLKNGGDKEYEEILKSFYDTDDNAEKKYALVTLGATPSAALRARTLDWAVRSGEVKLQDFFYCIGSVAGSADGCRTAWEYYKANFAFIKDKLSKASGSLMDATIGSSVIRFCTLEQADEIEAFFKANPVKSSERRVTQILEGIRSNGAMLKRILASDLIKPSFWAVDDEPAHA